MGYSKLQQKILHHLTTPGHPERTQALEDLRQKDAFYTAYHDETVAKIVNTYLNANMRGFCAEGIKRFRDAVDLPDTKTFKTRFVNVLIQVEVDCSPEGADTPGMDNGIAGRIQKAVAAMPDVHQAAWIDYIGFAKDRAPVITKPVTGDNNRGGRMDADVRASKGRA